MYSDNESHDSSSSSSSSGSSQLNSEPSKGKPDSQPPENASKMPKKMLNVNVGRSTIEMAEQFKSKDVALSFVKPV